jgi:hypothetical protein
MLILQRFFKRFLIDESRGLVVIHIYLFEELNMFLDLLVYPCIRLIVFIFGFLEQHHKWKILPGLIDSKIDLFILAVSPVGVLNLGSVVEVVVVIDLIVLLP